MEILFKKKKTKCLPQELYSFISHLMDTVVFFVQIYKNTKNLHSKDRNRLCIAINTICSFLRSQLSC
jgi:hypothetical protein